MDSRTSTTTTTFTKPKSLIIDTKHSSMVSTCSPTSSFAAFKPSPLNPKAGTSLNDKPNSSQRRSPHFPASPPLRPFPSICHSISTSKGNSPGARICVREDGCLSDLSPESHPASGARSPKTIEISSKWRGGFLVLGMTQAEFSRRD